VICSTLYYCGIEILLQGFNLLQCWSFDQHITNKILIKNKFEIFILIKSIDTLIFEIYYFVGQKTNKGRGFNRDF
jgi:hypothetical protein